MAINPWAPVDEDGNPISLDGSGESDLGLGDLASGIGDAAGVDMDAMGLGDITGSEAAKDQADAITAAAAEDNAFAHPDVEGVLGSQNVTKNADGTVSVKTSLSPQQQALVDSLYGDLGTGRQRVEDALYQRSTSRLDPQWNDAEEAKRTRLYNMGLTEGDAAYDKEMRNLGFAKSDAYEQARERSIAAGGQEQSRLINALMASANPGLQSYYGKNDSTSAAIAAGNIQASVPSALDIILGIL